jgi:collagenase-like PrtC family protease
MTGKLTLGPVLFHWPPEKLRDFYFRIADEAPLDSVCIGEVVCAKRAPFFAPHLPEIAERLEKAGKEVVFSTLALIMNEREMKATRELVAADGLFVEANDMAAVALLSDRPHAIGPYVNVYNEGTLEYLARRGAVRVCLPVELPAASLAVLAAVPRVELEVQVFGRLPLALAARCYHARSRSRHKDNCRLCQTNANQVEFVIPGFRWTAQNTCDFQQPLGD